ncbi:MAG TPA: hypothetical protein VLI41_14020 [Phenylobacterium sp.]|uniref:hypothetical protein n=1 Tax=Phenylobacterium sp. TaxID=1871053 RepID=UPI002B77D2C1|nr:hypothetical protein [Phenylobacterium sp.]HSV04311.1 hypothetical protein [Phenylobacterium sp.]
MTGQSLLSLGLAAVCIVAAILLWRASGSQPLPLPHIPTHAHAPGAAAQAPSSGAAGVLGGPRNLQAAINASNTRVAGALNNAK